MADEGRRPCLFKVILLFGAVLVTIATFVSQCVPKRGEPEVHLIPQGYVGPVYVVWDQPHGASTRDERGWRVYDIGSDGVHLSAFEPNIGRISGWEYFYVGPDSTRRQLKSYLPMFADDEDMADSTLAAWGGSIGGTGGNSRPGGGLTMYKYFVGTAEEYTEWTKTRRVGDASRALKDAGAVW